MKATRIDITPHNGTTEARNIWKGYLFTPQPSRWQRFVRWLRGKERDGGT